MSNRLLFLSFVCDDILGLGGDGCTPRVLCMYDEDMQHVSSNVKHDIYSLMEKSRNGNVLFRVSELVLNPRKRHTFLPSP